MIYELAGIVGINPGPFTLRQLCWMAEGAARDRWNRTAALLALTANCHRDPKKTRPAKPQDFHPYLQQRSHHPPEAKPTVGVDVLKQVFIDHRPTSSLRAFLPS